MVFEDLQIVENSTHHSGCHFTQRNMFYQIQINTSYAFFKTISAFFPQVFLILIPLPFTFKESLALYCNTLSSNELLFAKFGETVPVALETK